MQMYSLIALTRKRARFVAYVLFLSLIFSMFLLMDPLSKTFSSFMSTSITTDDNLIHNYNNPNDTDSKSGRNNNNNNNINDEEEEDDEYTWVVPDLHQFFGGEDETMSACDNYNQQKLKQYTHSTSNCIPLPLPPQTTTSAASNKTNEILKCKPPKIVFFWDGSLESILLDQSGAFSANMAANVPMGERIVAQSLVRGLDTLGYVHFLINSKQMFTSYYRQFKREHVITFTNIYVLWSLRNERDQREIIGRVEGGVRSFLILDFWGSMWGVKDDVMVPGFFQEQYLSAYPDQFVNTFLGFIVDECPINVNTVERENSGLVWGKKASYFNHSDVWKWDMYRDVQTRFPNMTLYGTVSGKGGIPPEIQNLKPMARIEFQKKLASQAFFMSIGVPHDGPSALEAMACGVPYINTVYANNHEDVHSRRMSILKRVANDDLSVEEASKLTFKRTSQHKYTETFTEPYVYHIHRNDNAGMVKAIGKIMNRSQRLEPLIPREFRYDEYMKRLKSIMNMDWKNLKRQFSAQIKK